MINKETVYKIKLTALNEDFYGGDAWAKGTNIHKRGGSGKTWTSKKLVNKSFEEILCLHYYGLDFTAEIVTFNLEKVSVSKVVV